jgi:hypothetical protein
MTQHVASVSDSLENDYHWITSTQVLWLRHVHRPYPPDYLLASIDEKKPLQAGHYQAFALVTNPVHERPLEAFNAQFAPLLESTPGYLSRAGYPGYTVTFHPPYHALSPDGKWLLWHRNNRRASSQEWIACALDGSQQRTWQTRPDPISGMWLTGQARWMPDSRFWIQLETTYKNEKYKYSHALIHDCRDPQAVEERDMAFLAEGIVLGMTSSQTLLIWHPSRRQKTTKILFDEVELALPKATARERTVSMPHETEVAEVSLSPQGNQLAWVLADRSENPVLYTLWTSRLNGSEMRPLIQLKGIVKQSETSFTGQCYSWPRNIRWLPQGDQLSYLYNHGLWMIATT